jgi:hypothetical protein
MPINRAHRKSVVQSRVVAVSEKSQGTGDVSALTSYIARFSYADPKERPAGNGTLLCNFVSYREYAHQAVVNTLIAKMAILKHNQVFDDRKTGLDLLMVQRLIKSSYRRSVSKP